MISVSHLTALDAEPLDFLKHAARAGFKGIGLRITPAPHAPNCYPIVGNRQLIADLKSVAGDTGVRIVEGESFGIFDASRPSKYLPALEVAAELGVEYVVSSSNLADEVLLADLYAELAEHCRGFGIGVGVEFMPSRPMATMADALSVVCAAGHPNLKLLIDALHLFRSNGSLSELAAVDPSFIGYVHVCDAPMSFPGVGKLSFESLESRLYPGFGEFPLVDLLSVVPYGIPLSLEAPCYEYRDLEPGVRLTKAATATRMLESKLNARVR